ncbi:MAG: adenylate/guanylate cyclase domain-containing protein [Gammaproteobacteria bacterium]|nr:adenylate/guanylate cyclase domain-containing protein [Gammaproteobacteria bacterium]
MIEWKKHLGRSAIGLILSLIFLLYALGYVRLPVMHNLENLFYDFRLNHTVSNSFDNRIVIVDIDEKSLKKEGHWPWGRDRLSLLVDNLFRKYNVSLVAFDVLFAEPDKTSGLDVLNTMANGPLKTNKQFVKEFNRIRPKLEKDKFFADTLKNRPVIFGYYFKNETSHGDSKASLGQLPPPINRLDDLHLHIPFVQATGYGAPLPILMSATQLGGFIDMPLVDTDGIIRKVPLVQKFNGELYASLSLSILQALLGNPPVELKTGGDYEEQELNLGLEYISTGGFDIPVDEQGTAIIPYRGRFPSFPYVSAVDVIEEREELKTLENTVVIIGTTAAGLLDLRSTPMQNFYPGVEVHANMLSGMLDQTVKHKPGFVHGIEFLLLLIIAILMSVVYPRLRLAIVIVLTVFLVTAIFSLNFYAWRYLNIDLPIVSQAIMITIMFSYHLAYEFFVENRSKRQITRLFGQYVPATLVEEMSQNPQDFAVDGGTREMSVMFTDIRRFTNLAEKMPPQQLTQLMNMYFTEMTKVIHSHRGTIDKYIGDCIMAFWGAPLNDEKHAQHALDSAMMMVSLLPDLNKRFEKIGLPSLEIGVGINSGMMHVGNMGSEFRMAYTVLGDEVNLSSRLESLTKRYNVPIIVSESTASSYSDLIYRELDLVRVLGKDTPVRIFQPLGKPEELSPKENEELEMYRHALTCYRQRQWGKAKDLFLALIKLSSGPILYQEYIGRIVQLEKNPPDNSWDGVYKLKGK